MLGKDKKSKQKQSFPDVGGKRENATIKGTLLLKHQVS